MAMPWSSEFTVTEHRDLKANAMSMDWDGSKVLLAGKGQIAVKSLNDSSDNLKKFVHQNKYEVGGAEWNPTSMNSHFCALTTQQKIELMCWRESGVLELAHVLKCHTRMVTGINWHRVSPHVLASSSIDTYTYVWDIRDPRKPCANFPAVASANHVQWNKLSNYILATAHDGDIRIWDERKGSCPLRYISAHLTKIHDVDWSPTHEHQLATCSQDGTVKLFDVTNPKRAESVIQTGVPVWRARYIPFGEGLLTAVVPQTRRGGENSLLLWNLSNLTAPVHTFVGHTDVVLEFDWRRNRGDASSSEYQLVTWAKDHCLRLWKIEPFLQKLCGHDLDGDSQLLGEDEEEYVHITTNDLPSSGSNAGLDTGFPAVESLSFSESYHLDKHFPQQDISWTLDQEFSLLTASVNPNFKFEDMDVLNRSCSVQVTVNDHQISLLVSFPPSYPLSAAPSFQIEDSSTVDNLLKTKLLKVLKQTAQHHVRKNRACLENCLAQMVATVEVVAQMADTEAKQLSRLPASPPLLASDQYNMYGSPHDSHVPYPRTCGARFSSADMLVCFYKPSCSRRRPGGVQETTTPRSLCMTRTASLSYHPLYGPGGGQDAGGKPSYYLQERSLSRSRSKGSLQLGSTRPTLQKTSKTVTVYDASKLFLVHRELGRHYVFDTRDVVSMCRTNAAAAAAVGRPDLVQVWTLASLIATPTVQGAETEEDAPWAHHPLSKSLTHYLITHYAQMSDVQTAAMLCCAFTNKANTKMAPPRKTVPIKPAGSTPGGSPYHTIHLADSSMEGWHYSAVKQNRSNSWSESVDDFKLAANIVEHREVVETDYENQRLLTERHSGVYDAFKRQYADTLQMWGQLEARALVMKLSLSRAESPKAVEFLTECQKCKKAVLGSAYCLTCKKATLRCAICRVLVRGSSNFCLSCGHGGHVSHMVGWFKTETVCPTGCGCQCLVENAALLEH